MKNVAKSCLFFVFVAVLSVCILCACTPPHTHSWSNWTSDDAQTHSRSCDCSANETEAHTFENDVCILCGYDKSVKTHTHTFESEYNGTDETGHWHIATCEHTNEKCGFEPHDYENGVCKKCGYEKAVITVFVSLDYNGATDGFTESMIRVSSGQAIGELPKPTRNNYIFKGWYLDKTEITADTIWIWENGQETIVAQWQAVEYTVAFIVDSKTVCTQKFSADKYEITEPAVPVKVGYEGKWEEYNLFSGKNFTVNAIYTPIEYTITFVADGNTVDTRKYTVESKDITEPTVPEKSHYYGSWDNYTLSTGDITVDAVYTAKQYTVTFFADSKKVGAQTYTVENKRITEPAVPEKTGYKGVWEEYVLTTGDVIVVAEYSRINYTATFVADGKTVATQTYTSENKRITVPTVPAKTGYDCAWEDYDLIDDNITVNAVYTPKQYTITLDYDGAKDESVQKTLTVTFDKAIGTLPTPSRDKYDFVGWYFENKQVSASTEWKEDENYSTLTAKWRRVDPTEGLVFELSTDGLSYEVVTLGSVTDKDIVIPSTYNNLPVSAILTKAFVNSNLTRVVIPESVTSIASDAFSGCKYITEAMMPAHAISCVPTEKLITVVITCGSSICDNAFKNSKNLTSVNLSDSVTSIGNSSFYGCDSLKNIVLPDKVVEIGSSAFSNCSSLADIIIPNGVINIGSYAFAYCSSLTEITLPDSVTNMGASVFSYCQNLTNIKMSENITILEDKAFYGCSSLIDITIPEKVATIGSFAFSGCVNLASVELPDSVTDIRMHAFFGCGNFTDITIPENVTSIGSNAFENCYRLVEVFNKSSLAVVAGKTDNGYVGFYAKNIYTPTSGGSKLSVDNGFVIYNESILVDYIGNETTITIPSGIKEINSYALYNHRGLVSVTIPDGVTSICASAFENCQGLTSIAIPNGVISIGASAFSGCNSLEIITVPDSVTSIGQLAFEGCDGITDATMPTLAIPFVPQSSLSTVVITSGTSIAENAFKDCASLTNVTVSGSVTSIGEAAFQGCNSLEKIVLPFAGGSAEVTDFNHETVFGYIFGYTIRFDYPENSDDVIQYSEGLFDKYFYHIPASLKHVEITDCNIQERAFVNCNGITSVSMGSGVTSIGKDAFSRCSGLTSVTIGDNVTSIATYAFYGCSSLTSITIPKNVTNIDSGAFLACERLIEVYDKSALKISAGSSDNGDVALYAKNVYTKEGESKLVAYKNGFVIYDGNTLVDYRGPKSEIAISRNITVINNGAFSDRTGLTRVVIPDSVTEIGADAFYNCSSLTGVIIPDSVTSIGNHTFSECKSLISVVIPSSVKSIGEYAFYNCGSLASISISENVTSIGDSAFQGCCSLANITVAKGNATYHSDGNCLIETKSKTLILGCNSSVIPTDGSVTSIDEFAFAKRDGLVSITIPDKVKSIGDSAFSECHNLESVIVGNGVTSIGSSAFQDCYNLTSVTIGNSVTSIGDAAFQGCEKLTNISMPDSITYLGYNVFDGCHNVQYNEYDNASYLGNESNPYVVFVKVSDTISASYSVKENTKVIYQDAFNGHINLTSVVIPDSVKFIGNNAFSNCTGLTNVTMSSGIVSINTSFDDSSNLQFNEYDNALYLGNDLNPYVILVRAKDTSIVSCTINKNTKIILPFAFENCGNLRSIVIPDSVVSIGDSAFADCDNIVSASMPTIAISAIPKEKLETLAITSGAEIADDSFSGCMNLKSVVISDKVSRIGSFAFRSCYSLVSVVLGNGLTYIGDNAFRECSQLAEIIISDSIIGIGDFAFIDCSSLTNIIIPESLRSIGYAVFSGCGFTDITIPDSITSIGEFAFSYCSNLESITIPDSVTEIGDSAFYSSGLTSVTIPDSITSIEENVFADCDKLTSVTIPNTVTSIGDWAFSYCDSLKSVIVPGSVKSIGRCAFLYCGAESLVMTEGVECIGDEAFYCCENLADITIPESVTSIGADAFESCYLNKINYLGSIASWCEISFASAHSNPLCATRNLYLNDVSVKEIVIPNGVTSIGNYAFVYGDGFTGITIPDSVTSIGDSAFEHCNSFTSIVIPKSITRIGNNAFDDCDDLKSVYYKGSAEEWKNMKIGNYNTCLTSAVRYYYSESEPKLFSDEAVYDGNYWKYDTDGVTPIVWKKD